MSPGAFDTTISGGNDAFVTKVDGVGSTISYSTFLGGSDLEDGRGIAVDGSGQAYVTGITESTDFPLRPIGGALQGNAAGRLRRMIEEPLGTTVAWAAKTP